MILLAAGFAIAKWTSSPAASANTEAVAPTNRQSEDGMPLRPPLQDGDVAANNDARQTLGELLSPDTTSFTVTLFEYEGASKIGVPGLVVEFQEEGHTQNSPQQVLRTDEVGQVVTLVPSDSTVRIVLKSSSWRFVGRPYATSKDVYVKGESAERALPVERISEFTVDVTYEDGRRYSGVASVSPDTGVPHALSFSEDGSSVLALPAHKKWTLHVSSRRPGFGGGVLALKSEDSEGSNTLVLARVQIDSGVFEVQCDNVAEGSLVDIRISARTDSVSAMTLDEISNWPANLPYFSTALAPGAYDVRVQLSEHSSDGKTTIGLEVVELVTGQTQTVRVRLALPGSIRAVVVDQHNQPIVKARLAYSNSTHFNWDWTRDEPPGSQSDGSDAYAFSDVNGVVVLTGLSNGSFEFICHAEGYGQVSLTAVVPSGGEYDLGMIILAAAVGKIRIEIEHPEAAESDEYEVTLLKPLAGIVRSAERFKGKSHVIGELALLPYVVSIRYVAGGYGAYAKQITLTADTPEAIVKFVMRRPPLKPDDD
ncbi:MAG: hypothetical protein K8I27_01885 [Planctomycetes bacterium]|nr:hypothetical protein [Planctomycetota bacterium]